MKKTLKLGMIALFSLGVAVALPQQETIQAGYHAIKLGGKTYNGKFYSDYTSLDEVIEAGEELNQTINDEAMTLLKNKDNVLPFTNVKKITVLGKASADPQLSGSGSGASGGTRTDLYDSLEQAGFTLNPVTMAFYQDDTASGVGPQTASFFGGGEIAIGETPMSMYSDYVKSSFEAYNDAAVILIKRSGSEGNDNPRRVGDFATDSDEVKNAHHYFQLSANEEALINMATENFSKVVLLVNSPSPIELGDVEANDKVQAIVWTGLPGGNGMKAIGRILNGSVNPSGKTVDTWAADYRKDPTWNNFGNGSQTSSDMTTANYTLLNPDGKNISGRYDSTGADIQGDAAYGQGNSVTDTFVRYEEGIYTGYRYYETAGVEKGEDWYKENVVYPFGYGLSYTSFSVESVSWPTTLDLTNENKVVVKVTNTGSVAGKKTIELYFHAPYEDGKTEKASEVLAAYAKTDMLEPGESQELTLSFYAQDVASYDDTDKDGDGHTGYELDAGNYTLSVNDDAHNQFINQVYNDVAATNYDTDRTTGNTISNAFDGANASLPSKDGMFTAMTRASDNQFVQPDAPTTEEEKVDTKMLNKLINVFQAYQLDEGTSWYKTVYDEDDPRAINDTIKANFTNGTWKQQPETGDRDALYKSFADMAQIGYDDDDEWNKILNNLKYSEMLNLMAQGGWSTTSLSFIGKDRATDRDGPAGLGSIGWAVEVNIAATFNDELSYEFGKLNGEESLWRDIPGWYAPAMDAHRSVFGGRNFEYYSEDPVLAGNMGAQTIFGAQEKGAHVYLKHYAVNDQETSRNDICTFLSEQTLREVNLRSFEIAIKKGNPRGIMGGMNRIGLNECYANYGLMTQVTRDEWGFEGCIETDANFGNDTRATTNNPLAMYCSGVNLNLGNLRTNSDYGTYDATANKVTITDDDGTAHDAYSFWYHVRQNAKAVLYETSHSSETDNGYDFSSYTQGATVDFYASVAGSASISADLTAVGSDNAKYELAEGSELPDGLTLSGDGTISGTPTTVGNYTVDVVMKVDGWISKTATITINVNTPITVTGETNLTVNTAMSEVSLACVSSTMEIGDTVSVRAGWWNTYQVPVTSFSYELARGASLPDGLTLSTDGKITGTPTTAGTYTFNVNYNANYDADTTLGVRAGYVTLATASVTLTVTDPNATEEETTDEKIADLEKQIAELEAKIEASTDATEIAALKEEIADLKTQIAELEDKVNSSTDNTSTSSSTTTTTDDSEGGCGGSVIAATTTVGALALLGVSLAFKKKREEK